MNITPPEDAARRILIAYGVSRDECQAPEFDDIMLAIAAQHPGLVEEFSYLPWPQEAKSDGTLRKMIGRDAEKLRDMPDVFGLLQVQDPTEEKAAIRFWPSVIGDPILKPSTIKRAYTKAELDAAVMAERERWIGGARVSIPTDTMEQEIAAHVRRAVKAERERCAALVDPEIWDYYQDSDEPYTVLKIAAQKIRGD